MIYADHAATTRLDEDAFAAMRPYLMEQYANASQPYSLARGAREALKKARRTIAACINAAPEEIFFTSGGTESDNWAIKGCGGHGGAIVTSQFEHHAVLRACQRMEAWGHPVVYLRPTEEGFVSPALLESALTNDIRLVSIMMANNEIGTIQPIQALCAAAHRRGAVFHTDAVQALGHIPVDVQALGVDLLSASAHKFQGPKGIGFLYVRKGTPLSAYADGGAQEFGMRAGTENVAAIVGMEAALRKSVAGMEAAGAHLRKLERRLIEGLTAAGIAFLQNGAEPRLPGNLSLSFAGVEGETLLHRLDLMGIMVSTGSACDGGNTRVSHVLRAIGAKEPYAPGTIRISLGRENTEEEAAQIAQALVRILKHG